MHEEKIINETTEPATGSILLVALGTFIFVAASLIGSLYLFKGTVSAEKKRKELTGQFYSISKIREYETKTLNSVEKKDGKIKLPIEAAIRKTVNQYNR